MDCLDCKRATDCHNDILNDLQIIKFIIKELENNQIDKAKDELIILGHRFTKRNLELTGRK